MSQKYTFMILHKNENVKVYKSIPYIFTRTFFFQLLSCKT